MIAVKTEQWERKITAPVESGAVQLYLYHTALQLIISSEWLSWLWCQINTTTELYPGDEALCTKTLHGMDIPWVSLCKIPLSPSISLICFQKAGGQMRLIFNFALQLSFELLESRKPKESHFNGTILPQTFSLHVFSQEWNMLISELNYNLAKPQYYSSLFWWITGLLIPQIKSICISWIYIIYAENLLIL